MTINNTVHARFDSVVKNTMDLATALSNGTFRIERQEKLSIDWAPFDYTPPTARLAVLGITPGRTQALNALSAFRRALLAGQDNESALRTAKLEGSFSGAMRGNLVGMLDSIDAQHVLGVSSCADLFRPEHELVHLTSALRYPVFVNSQNYNGTPNMLRTPVLRSMIETYLAAEVRLLPEALWLPLGPKPAAALHHLASIGVLSADRIIEGMPHPSGANIERIKFFLGQKARADLSAKTRPDLIELARDVLRGQVARLRSA